MTAELTPYQPRAEMVDYQNRAVARLSDWVQSADAAYQVAERLVQSSFVPAAFKGKPIEATAAVLAGLEMGLLPMASLRAFDVIQGTAAPRAITLRAIVQSFGHEIELVESTNTRCRMRGRRRGSQTWQTVTWTLDRAKDLGLTGKDQWKKQPGTMLVARCTSELSRLIAADAILGIGYTSEEIIDGADLTIEPDAATEPVADTGTRRMSRPKVARIPNPDREPDPDPEPSGMDEFAKPEMITDPQSRKMHALFRELDLDRDGALAFCGDLIGHTITTTKELDKREASIVIDEAEKVLAERADAEDQHEEIPGQEAMIP